MGFEGLPPKFQKLFGLVGSISYFACYRLMFYYEQKRVSTSGNSIDSIFSWSGTDEGYSFWHNIHIEVCRKQRKQGVY